MYSGQHTTDGIIVVSLKNCMNFHEKMYIHNHLVCNTLASLGNCSILHHENPHQAKKKMTVVEEMY